MPIVNLSDYDRMGRSWLGLGSLKSPCWFVGMEPGGDSSIDGAWATRWATTFSSAPTVDLHASATEAERPYLDHSNRLHATWSPLIRCRLAYAGVATDDQAVLAYQRDQFAKADGYEALLELSAYSAKSLSEPSHRKKYLASRVEALGKAIDDHGPEVVIFYGRTYAGYHEEIAGGSFDADGFRQRDGVWCALTLHPYQRFGKSPLPEHWVGLGSELRRRVHDRFQ